MIGRAARPNRTRSSHTGYNLATVLLEHRFHRDWSALVREEVLAPLGMAHTTADIDGTRNAVAVAWGYLGLAGTYAGETFIRRP